MCWCRFTSMERYVEERIIAVVTCSVGNKGYMNADAYGENYYEFVAKELTEFICANFQISDRPEDTYIAGLSMGGYGTLAHGLGHPELFLCIGNKDFLYEQVTDFHNYLLKKSVKHYYDDISGYEHEWAFWDLELPKFLDWLPRTDTYADMPVHKM